MIKRYQHTQVGYLNIITIAVAMVLIGILLPITGNNWITIVVLIILGVVLVLFSTLTVAIWEDELEIRFGPGLIRKRFKLNEIESCQVVKSPWYYGWGIRVTPRGTLYRVSGFYSVEINLKTGKKYLIGTDVPQELEEAIKQTINSR
jgi:hypothetical protein